jgi:Uma2 family endonuclease
MVRICTEVDEIHVPSWVVDLKSFRRWADEVDFPNGWNIGYCKGEVWVDCSRQQVFTHVDVKGEFIVVVGGLVDQQRSGHFFGSGLMTSNVAADYAVVPDATFFTNDNFRSDKVRLLEDPRDGGCVEIEGTPDMVLEVLSRSSVHKDTVMLRQAYWEAGIPEYWLVDARKEPLKFDILRYTARGYSAVRKQAGWVKSAVFGKAFRLTQHPGIGGHPEFNLEAR